MIKWTRSASRPVDFRADRFWLRGWLHLPPATEPPLVVGSHGLFSSSASPKQIALAERLERLGVAFLRFDHRGCGLSGGDPAAGLSFDGRCRDLAAAVAATRAAIPGHGPLGLFGSSFGGAVCLACAADLGAQATVTVAAPLRSAALPGLEHDATARTHGLYFDLGGRPLAGVRRLLAIHGTADEVVPVQQVREIAAGAAEPARTLLLIGGDHRLSRPHDQARMLSEAAAWLARGLGRER